MKRAGLVESESGGLAPDGDGWFVLNARDARWLDGDLGKYCTFEGDEEARFPQLGVNLNLLQPGEPMTMYHREHAQEDFLVLAGECLLVVEGEERPTPGPPSKSDALAFTQDELYATAEPRALVVGA